MSKLIQNSVRRTLFQMAFPMLAGTISMNAYNLVDTWFVSKLGTDPLAAMGLTFPVVMVLTFLAGGVGTGVTTLMSHALGRKDQEDASRITTHGFILVILVAGVLAFSGFLAMNPVFNLLGADKVTLPLVKEYMATWFLGAIFMAIPMMGNGILISLGDSKSASRFMAAGAIINCVLDPIMIFGLFGFPKMGIRGAALATVIAQIVSTVWLIYLLLYKFKLLKLIHIDIKHFPDSFKRVMKFAIPGSLSMMLMPISAGVITALVSRYGNEAIAAISAVSRIETFAFVIPMALGMSLVPFTSQNFGAGHLNRIREAKRISTIFAIGYGGVIAVVFFIFAPFIADIFTEDPNVSSIFINYIRVISFGFGMMEVHRYAGFFLTGMHRPISSTIANIIRVIVLLIPLSLLGSHTIGISGIFYGRLLTDLSAGIISIIWVTLLLRTYIAKESGSEVVFFD